MKGKIMSMELRKGWKGFIIFIIVVTLIAAGYAQLYPSVMDDMEENELVGAELVNIEIDGDEIHLSWRRDGSDEMNGSVEYLIVEDTNQYMPNPRRIIETTDNHTIIERNKDEEVRYFGVIALIDETRTHIGMASTEEPVDPIEELMDTPFVRLFSAGREDLSMADMEGFISIEVYSWWILLVGVYLAYLSVKSVTTDFEEDRLDILLSSSVSRKGYLLEKFSALSLFVIFMHVIVGLMIMLSVYSVGETPSISYLIAMLIAVPMFMVIIAVSMFFAVLFKRSRTAVGVSFGVILVQFGLFATGHLVESLEPVHTFTISHYWDYNSVLLDGVVYPWHLVLLTAIAIIFLVASMKIFQKSDVPS